MEDDDITDINIDGPPSKRKRLNAVTKDVKFKPLSFTIDWFGGSDKGKKPHMEDRRIAVSDLSSKFKHSFTAQNKFGISPSYDIILALNN